MADNTKVVMTTLDPLNIKHYTPFIYPVPIPSTPSDVNVVCVPIASAWFPLVVAALQTLIYEDVYEGDEESKQWAVMQAERLIGEIMEGGCSMVSFRNNPVDPCIVQYSNDNGETWFDGWNMSGCIVPSVVRIYRYNAVNNYHYEYSIDNGETWHDASTDDIRLTSPQPEFPNVANPACVAAENFIENMKLWVQTIVDVLSAGSTITAVAAVLVAFAAAFVTFPVSIVFIAPFARLLITEGLASIEAAFDEEFWDWLLCAVYVEFTLIDFEETPYITGLAMDNILNRLSAHGGTASEVIQWILVLTGAAGVASAAVMGDSDGTGCIDCQEWVMQFFGANPFPPALTVDHGGLHTEPNIVRASIADGHWFGDPQNTLEQSSHIDFTETHITRLVVQIRSVVNNPVNPRPYDLYLVSTEFPLGEVVASGFWSDDATRSLDTGVIDRHATSIGLVVHSRCQGNANDKNEWFYLAVYGDGDNPFD